MVKKNLIRVIIFLSLLVSTANNCAAKKKDKQIEVYGNTLNLGVGIGYYGYLGGTTPFFFANYEINVVRNFTLAPFIGFGSYRSSAYYYGGSGYYYTETVVPVGVKGTYYFDRLLHAGPRWDFYGAASLGFTYSKVTWQDGYSGNTTVAHTASPLYIDLHIGAEYHIARRLGVFLDLSTGVSTVGLAIHHR